MLWIGKLASEKPGEPYIWRNGLVYYKNQVIIPPNSYIIPQLLQEFYDSPLGGHSNTRWVKKGKNIIEESLVKWKKLPIEDATWETIQELWDRFHNLNLDDKVPLLEGNHDRKKISKIFKNFNRIPSKFDFFNNLLTKFLQNLKKYM
ncbi:hypothetical protein ACOSQ3_009964 [Xanthoceras sorbifolium]